MIVDFRQLLPVFLLILISFNSALFAGNKKVHLSEKGVVYELDRDVILLKQEGVAYKIKDIRGNSVIENQFKSYPIDSEFESNQFYWGKIQVINEVISDDEYKNWVLDFSLMITDLEVYVFNENGEQRTYRTGAFLPPNERSFCPKIKANVVSLELPANEEVDIYFKAISERAKNPPAFNLQLIEKEHYFKALIQDKAWNYFYLGMVLLLLFSNVILWRSIKINAYGYYSIYLFGIILFSAYNSGDLADFIHPIFANSPTYIYFFKLTIYFALVSYMAFIRSFLNLKEKLPRYDKYLKLFSKVAIFFLLFEIVCLVYFNYSFKYSDWWNMFYAGGFVALVVPLVIELKMKFPEEKVNYVFWGTFWMVIGITMTGYLRIKGVNFSFMIFQFCSLVEFYFFAKGLAYVRKEVEEQRLEAETAKEMMNFKDRFYGNLMHEFKTPLTVLKGLAADEVSNLESKWLIQQNTEQIERLINQLLDLSKLESGKLAAKYQKVEIIAAIHHWVASLQPLADRKKQLISFESSRESIFIDTDLIQLKKIVFNLLSNAIKFTPINGAIEIGAKQDGQQFHLYIKDTGDGIPASQIEKIFERFYTTDKNSTIMMEGTGIGLSLVKELTEWMGGQVEVKSKIGEGTVFYLLFPLRQMGAEVSLEKLPYSENEVIAMPLSFYTEAVAEEFDVESEKSTLLIIEDNEGLVLYFKKLFKEKYQIVSARDGKEGIAKAREIVPHIIICDLMMPKLNGYEVCQKLKKEELTSHIPIIMVTAKSGTEVRLQGLDNGVDVFLEKPFIEKELIIHVNRLAKKQQEMQALLVKLPKTEIAEEAEEMDNFEKRESIFFKEQEFLKKVNQVLDKNIENSNYDLKLLCQDLGLTQRQLYNKLNSLTGYSTTKYIRYYRVIKARYLLDDKNKSITDISYDVGFNTPNQFNRVFKEFYGKKPKEFRK